MRWWTEVEGDLCICDNFEAFAEAFELLKFGFHLCLSAQVVGQEEL